MKRRKLLSLALALLMALSLLPAAAQAADAAPSFQINWLPKDLHYYNYNSPDYSHPYFDFESGLCLMRKDGDGLYYVDAQGNLFPESEAIPRLGSRAVEVTYQNSLLSAKYFGSDGTLIYQCELEDPYEYYEIYNPEPGEAVGCFSEGLANVGRGYIDQSGDLVISTEGKYLTLRAFRNGFATVRGLNQKWGAIDKSGNEVVPCQYEYPLYFSYGVSPARIKVDGEDKYGVINTANEIVAPFVYDSMEYGFIGGIIEFTNRNPEGSRYLHTSGYLDYQGNAISPSWEWGLGGTGSTYFDHFPFFDEEYKSFYDGEKYGFYHNGELLLSPQFDGVPKEFSDGVAIVRNDKTLIAIDTSGRELFTVPMGYLVDGFHDGVGVIRGENDKWGYIDEQGHTLVPCQFSVAGPYCDGYAIVGVYDPDRIETVYGILKFDLPATAYASTQMVNVDGRDISFQCYALKDESGNLTNYIKLRDLAILLNGSAAQFQVGWDGGVTITTQTAYVPNGSELTTPYSGDRAYQSSDAATKVNGQAAQLAAFVLQDDQGGGYTYYQLRDLGKALGFNVGWSADRGIFLETDKPYDPNN